jgi:solute carrier family 34 (sodium-dependent phosphate cotransporter)
LKASFDWERIEIVAEEIMNRERLLLVVKLAGIVLCLYFFIVGIGGMGHAFKLFGADFSKKILAATSVPIVSLFIGILATALVQSSSTSSSIIVGMVAGGALSIEGAVPMIMGANIGTTLTSKLVSLGHITRTGEFRRAFAAASVHDSFNLVTVAVLFPLEYFFRVLSWAATVAAETFQGIGGLKLGDPMKAATRPVIELIAEAVGQSPGWVLAVSVVLTFIMLWAIVKLLQSLVLEKLETFFDEHLFRNAGRAMVVGLLMTMAVQSSSITTSMIIPLAGAGILRLSQIFPFTIGANIGTTITAVLAALATGMIEAATVAFAHVLFNVLGACIIWPIPKLRAFPPWFAEKLAEVSVKNRLIPIVLILLIFFIIPLIVSWTSISRAFGSQ